MASCAWSPTASNPIWAESTVTSTFQESVPTITKAAEPELEPELELPDPELELPDPPAEPVLPDDPPPATDPPEPDAAPVVAPAVVVPDEADDVAGPVVPVTFLPTATLT